MKKGVSLISLVTIISVSLLLVSIVAYTATDVDMIPRAYESNFKNDLKSFDDEIEMAMGKAYIDDRSVTRRTIVNLDEIAKFAPRLAESQYKEIAFISNGRLALYGDRITEEQRRWANDINIEISDISIDSGIVNASASPTTWTNKDVTVELTYIDIPTGYVLQYKTSEDEDWKAGEKVTVSQNTTITARIWNERLC